MDLKSGHDLDGRRIDDGLTHGWLFSSILLAYLLYQRYFSGKFPETFRKFPEIFWKISRIIFFRKTYNPTPDTPVPASLAFSKLRLCPDCVNKPGDNRI